MRGDRPIGGPYDGRNFVSQARATSVPKSQLRGDGLDTSASGFPAEPHRSHCKVDTMVTPLKFEAIFSC
jgi:hypothetical protein